MEQIESTSGECQQVTRRQSAPCLTLHQYDEGASSGDVGHTCKKHKTQHKGIFGPNSCWHRISQDSNSRLNILQIEPSTNINVCTMYNVQCTMCIAHICIWAAFCTATMTTRLVEVLMRRILVERSFAKQGSLCYRFSTRHLLPRSDTQWHGGQKIGQGAISRFEQKSCSTQMWRRETRRNRTCWVAANFWHESGFWETEDVDSSATEIREFQPDRIPQSSICESFEFSIKMLTNNSGVIFF